MNVQMKKRADAAAWAADLSERIRELLNEASVKTCGLIAVRVDRMDKLELQDLETRVNLEHNPMPAQFGFDPHFGILTVLLPGQTLAQTHYVSLSLKEFLQNADMLSGRIAVAGYPECAEPEERVLRGLLADLMTDPAGDEVTDIFIAVGQGSGTDPNSIVVIDHNEDLTEFLQVRLRLKGYDVHVASDGMEGLQLVEQVSPDLVLTELALPVLDGYEVIHRIRQKKAGRDSSKIVVLTDKGLEQEVQKCFELGVADYIKKPFSPIELEARIRRLIG